MPLTTQQLSDVFVRKTHLLTEDQIDHAIQVSRETMQSLEQLVMEYAFISPQQYLECLTSYFHTPATELDIVEIDRDVVTVIREKFALENSIIAFAQTDNQLHIAVSNPQDETVLSRLKTEIDPFGPEIKIFVTTEQAIKRAMLLYDQDIKVLLKNLTHKPDTSATVIVDLVNAIIRGGILFDASDIHIEPEEAQTYIRYRIDGVLQLIGTIPKLYHEGLMSRLKIMAELKIDQKHLPQDGRFAMVIKGQEINVRISTVPSLWGEKPVLRLLLKEAHLFDINNLGLLPTDIESIKRYVALPYGLVLVCGPTGSGKTTTLYALLQQMGNERIDTVNISTIEDPIEYTIPRVTQIQTQPEIDLTFASGLRALLRQDPDIIMVGEIRDVETADFAVRAALVGRLMLSSLHTNDAPGAIPRLLDMGIEPYMLSSTLSMVIAQRLARKLCTFCRESYMPSQQQLSELREFHQLDAALKTLKSQNAISSIKAKLRFYRAVGCQRCNFMGYNGRTGIYEILTVSDELRGAINSQGTVGDIQRLARLNGMKTMFEDGLMKVLLGQVDLEEVIKVSYS